LPQQPEFEKFARNFLQLNPCKFVPGAAKHDPQYSGQNSGCICNCNCVWQQFAVVLNRNSFVEKKHHIAALSVFSLLLPWNGVIYFHTITFIGKCWRLQKAGSH